MKIKNQILIAIFIFSFSIAVFPMKDSIMAIKGNQAELSAMKLQQKILLSDSQTNNIKSILTGFISGKNFTDDMTKRTITEIESVLDQRQKEKFDIIKTEWWNNFLKSLNQQSHK